MSTAEKIKFLELAGAGSTTHSKKALLDHLVGTHSLLESWNCRASLCDAGLFHSVYGTEHFGVACLAPADRHKVKALIGEEAEELAWLFGILDRKSFDENIFRSDGFKVRNRGNGEVIILDVEKWKDLVTLTFANTLEAIPRLNWVTRRSCRSYLWTLYRSAPGVAQDALRNATPPVWEFWR